MFSHREHSESSAPRLHSLASKRIALSRHLRQSRRPRCGPTARNTTRFVRPHPSQSRSRLGGAGGWSLRSQLIPAAARALRSPAVRPGRGPARRPGVAEPPPPAAGSARDGNWPSRLPVGPGADAPGKPGTGSLSEPRQAACARPPSGLPAQSRLRHDLRLRVRPGVRAATRGAAARVAPRFEAPENAEELTSPPGSHSMDTEGRPRASRSW